MLEEELKTYEAQKEDLLATADQQYVLIKGDQVVGTYESQMDAIAEGYRRFGNVPFLVRQVLEVEPVTYFNSSLVAS